MNRYPKIKAFLQKTGLLLSSVIISLLLCEAATRIIGLVKDINFTLYMKELTNSNRLPRELFTSGALLTPGIEVLATTSDFSVAYKINSGGLRDKEYTFEKPQGIRRAIALGDSFTFGEGVPYGERYTDIPESRLKNFEVLNFGIPGMGLDRSLVLYLMRGQQYAPDYVILFVNSSMAERRQIELEPDKPIWIATKKDAERWHARFYGHGNFRKSSGQTLYPKRKELDELSRGNVLFRHSYFLSYLQYRYTVSRLRNKMIAHDAKKWKTHGEYWDELLTAFPRSEKVKNDWQIYTAAVLDRYIDLSKRDVFLLIVINIDPHWDMSFVRKYGDDLLFIDLGPALKKRSLKHKLRFSYDGHFNPDTNGFIGDAVTEKLAASFAELSKKK